MMYTERAKTAAVSRGTSYVTNKTALHLHHFGGCSKRAIKRYSHSFRITWDKTAVSLLESGEKRYAKALLSKVMVGGHCLNCDFVLHC